MTQRVFIDEEGRLRANRAAVSMVVANFLEGDLQGTTGPERLASRLAEQVRTGAGSGEIVYDHHALIFDGDSVEVWDPLLDPNGTETVRLPARELLALVEEWRSMLETR